MIQKMINHITINTPDLDLATVTDIMVTFEQKSSGVELTYSGDSISVIGAHALIVTVPKADAMKLDSTPVRGQMMYTLNGSPLATQIFTIQVSELLREDGYGD